MDLRGERARLTPVAGSTPDAVQLSGAYDAATEQAELGWTANSDPSVTQLQIRATAGPEYEQDDESVLATFPATTEPRTWSGPFGLSVPGAAASFKIYAMTADGNERGSNTVTITRPAE